MAEAPCIENAGIENDGIENAGIGDDGIENAGIGEVGMENAGIENAGIDDDGIENAGIENAGIGDDGMEDAVISEDVVIAGTEMEDEEDVIGGTVMPAPPRLWAWAASPSVRVAATTLTRIALIVQVLRCMMPLDETNSRTIVIQVRELKLSFFVPGGLRERSQPDFTGGQGPVHVPAISQVIRQVVGWPHPSLRLGGIAYFVGSMGSSAGFSGGANGTTTTS